MEHVSEFWTCMSTRQYLVSARKMSDDSFECWGEAFFSIQSHPQLMPLNINWHPGTRSDQLCAQGWHVISGRNLIAWYAAFFPADETWVGGALDCVAQRIRVGFLNMSTLCGAAPQIVSHGAHVFNKTTGAGIWWLLVVCSWSFVAVRPSLLLWV